MSASVNIAYKMQFCTGGVVSNYNKHCTTEQQTPVFFFFGRSYWDSRATKYITVSVRARLGGKGTKVHEVPHFPQPKDSREHPIHKCLIIAAREERQDTKKGDKILQVHAHEIIVYCQTFFLLQICSLLDCP